MLSLLVARCVAFGVWKQRTPKGNDVSGHLDGPPPGPPDPPYIPGDLGAPSAEEFARRRGDVVQCSRCGQFSPPVPVTDDVAAAAWVEAECENERLRAERDAAIAAGQKLADAILEQGGEIEEWPEITAFRAAVSGSSEPPKESA